jgi:PEP-CTERM motif
MSRKRFQWALTLLGALAGGHASAGPTYQYVFDQSNYNAAPGGTVAVTVSIREMLNPQTDASLLAPGTDGLVGAGLLVQVAAPLATRPAQVTSVAGIQGNPAFSVIQVPQLPAPGVANSAGLLELAGGAVFGTITSETATSETVLLPLATFTFTAGDVPGEVNNLVAMDTTIDGMTPSANNVTAAGIVLDPLLLSGTATITVTTAAVPEPSSVALALVGLAGLAVGYRRMS